LGNLFSDEVGAIVLDFGAYSVRAGYAGEDTPKVKITKWIKNAVKSYISMLV